MHTKINDVLKSKNITEGIVWRMIKAFVTGKAQIDKNSEVGQAILHIEKEMKKKIPGSNKTRAEVLADELRQQGLKI